MVPSSGQEVAEGSRKRGTKHDVSAAIDAVGGNHRGGTGFFVLGACTVDRGSATGSAKKHAAPPELAVTPGDKARDVRVGAEVGPLVTGGRITAVRIVDDAGTLVRRRATRGRIGLGAERPVAPAAHLHRGGDRHRRLRADHHPHHHLHHRGGVDEAADQQHPVLRRQADVRHRDAGDDRLRSANRQGGRAPTCSVDCSSRRIRRSRAPGPGWRTAVRSTTGPPTSGGPARPSVSGPAWRVCRSARTTSVTPTAPRRPGSDGRSR